MPTLLKECDSVKVHTDRYSKSCYIVRNRYMVDCSALVIAVHDGRKSGGTAATIRYAHKMECDVFINQMIISKNPQFTGISAR